MSPNNLIKGNLYHHRGFIDVLIYKGPVEHYHDLAPISTIGHIFFNATKQKEVRIHEDVICYLREIV